MAPDAVPARRGPAPGDGTSRDAGRMPTRNAVVAERPSGRRARPVGCAPRNVRPAAPPSPGPRPHAVRTPRPRPRPGRAEAASGADREAAGGRRVLRSWPGAALRAAAGAPGPRAGACPARTGPGRDPPPPPWDAGHRRHAPSAQPRPGGAMFEALTGLGLSTAAGLNAYIPVLVVGLLAHFTDAVRLPPEYAWLSSGWALGVVAVLLLAEIVLDKVPVVDHVNDLIQTAVRPAAGGMVFSATQAAAELDGSAWLAERPWIGWTVGIVVALAVHALKVATRPIVNATTGG